MNREERTKKLDNYDKRLESMRSSVKLLTSVIVNTELVPIFDQLERNVLELRNNNDNFSIIDRFFEHTETLTASTIGSQKLHDNLKKLGKREASTNMTEIDAKPFHMLYNEYDKQHYNNTPKILNDFKEALFCFDVGESTQVRNFIDNCDITDVTKFMPRKDKNGIQSSGACYLVFNLTNKQDKSVKTLLLSSYNDKTYEVNKYSFPKLAGGKTIKKNSKSIKHKWTPSGRKVTLKDGSSRSLYQNPSKPNDFRIRRMVTRNGSTTATYIKYKL